MDALIQASKDGDNSKLSTLSGLKTDDDEEEKEEEEEEEEGKEEDTICEVQKDEVKYDICVGSVSIVFSV